MARKIETLLRMVAEMRSLETDVPAESKASLRILSDELNDFDLELITAAAKEPVEFDPFGTKD